MSTNLTGFPVQDVVGVWAKGPDARRFCNGMFTNNVRDIKPGEHLRHAMCDERGRVQGLLDMLCVSEESFLLVVEGTSFEAFSAHYEKYIVFDDVELSLAKGRLVHVLTEEVNCSVHCWRRQRLDVMGVDHWLDADVTLAFDVLDEAEVNKRRVLACQPRYPADIVGNVLVHELSLKDDLLHFAKGCYMGQETNHRVEVMGQVRRRLLPVRCAVALAGSAAPVVLTLDGVKVGAATSLVSDEHGTFGLCVCRDKASASSELLDAEGQIWTIVEPRE